jgi:hypothetical protein
MANETQTVRRTVQFKFTLPAANSSQLAAMMRSAAPFYEVVELNRQRVASDPQVQAYLRTWRSFFPGSVEIDVYQEAV